MAWVGLLLFTASATPAQSVPVIGSPPGGSLSRNSSPQATPGAPQNTATHMVEINGSIEDSSGQPLSATVVELHAWSGGLLSSQITNALGQFSFHVLSPGPYQLDVAASDGQHQFDLDSGNLGNLDLRLHRPGAPPTGGGVTANSSTVSLNDLQASGKAKSKLAAAQKALDKLDLGKAWKLVNEAITAAPNWGRAYLLRGVLDMESRNYASARSDLDVAVARNPKDSIALTELGKLYSTTGNLQLSGLYLHRALNIAPVLWPTYLELSGLDLKQGNFTEAQAMANNAMYSTPPAPPAVHFLAAEAADRLGDFKTAEAEYRSFVALEPPTPPMAKALALARHRIAEIAAANH
ncbi:MAG TPA: tetratricopeptide repeat protein [Terriglobales bacterium]|nr:tetratricopeptide repeat protein [Terriglobales bacterium]